jgi:hypothetical protein
LGQANQLYIEELKIKTLQQTVAFSHLERLLNEQCVISEEGLRIPIPSKKISSTSLQNPSDPDATFRTKRKEKHIPYQFCS